MCFQIINGNKFPFLRQMRKKIIFHFCIKEEILTQSSWLWKLRFLHLHVMHFGLAAFIEIWVYSTLFTLYSYNVSIIWSIHFTFLSLIWKWNRSLLILQRKNKTIFLFVCSQSVRFEKWNASHGSLRIIVSIVSSTVRSLDQAFIYNAFI